MSENRVSEEIKRIVEEIGGLNSAKLNELINEIKKEYNIQETAVIQTAGSGQVNEETEEKSSNVSLKLLDIGSQKIPVFNVIKSAVKEFTGNDISIMDAKKLAEKEGGVIWGDIARGKAEEIKKQLEEKGAKVEIK